jgi:hypothetical protein
MVWLPHVNPLLFHSYSMHLTVPSPPLGEFLSLQGPQGLGLIALTVHIPAMNVLKHLRLHLLRGHI